VNGWRAAGNRRDVGNFRHLGGRRAAAFAIALALLAVADFAGPDARAARGEFAYSLELNGPLLRDAQGVLERGLLRARADRAALVVVRLDTPGGLADVAREMAKDISDAPMPVIVFVAPGGARAESAGLALALAGDVAAMAPGTNIGSEAPFFPRPPRNAEERRIFKAIERRVRSDAAVLARSLAETHDRNADLAERMLIDGVNMSATEARRRELIDVLAADDRSLLRKLDGFRLKGPKARALRTAGLPVKQVEAEFEPQDSGGSGDRSSLLLTLGLVVLLPLVLATYWFVDRDVWRRRRWLWHRFRTRWRGPGR
jgi:membrane-bound serine protease (ClpP class)